MLSLRTLRDARAIRSARARASASRFMRSIARRIYSARGIPSARAHRSLVSSRSSGSLREIDSMSFAPDIFTRYPRLICAVRLKEATQRHADRSGDDANAARESLDSGAAIFSVMARASGL